MKLLVSLYTEPFLNKRHMSLSGWKRPGPFLPDNLLLVRMIIPVKTGWSTQSNQAQRIHFQICFSSPNTYQWLGK
jgi:hypothetical protein